ncbi:hypothetical protein CJ212_04990 [Gardnerella vaginalis]|uniref:Uncharacterized protein n=1 Tax=Gardnerella vaginalis (strain ATCC 14019 / 317) TaxID=525284 RepID=E3D821_GARV3|nr:hypothetical protein HMPREF0421_21316 [Gardnerella vaginalis ATCC 14019]PMC50421.1 hypothetical protein CJ212_04990 [Gardnerella vaginalis]TCH80653.1 hypothetical protein E0E48_04830 [Gardnerella vaginalis]TCH82120.1 hypothetical protein E0E46_04465 [Gardnerella vaginalis ATCC 14018 = JCM 11026]
MRVSKYVPLGITKKKNGIFSVVDVVAVLTDSKNPRDYWYRLKKRMS